MLPLAATLAAGCIGDEPQNAECDIETVSIHVTDPTSVFYHEYDTLQTVSTVADSIGFLARPWAKVEAFPVSLTITQGATAYIYQDGEWQDFHNGMEVDFSDEQVQRFKIISQNHAWSREYRICVVLDRSNAENELILTFDFNGNYALNDPSKTEDDNSVYYVWTETDETNVRELFGGESWKNGNPGYKLSKSSAKPLEYPTVPVVGGGPDGTDCIKMETMDAGPFGKMVNILIAPGSIFNGYFDVTNALKDARKATQFGLPFKHKPIHVSAWMKYLRGDNFQDNDGNFIEGVIDEPDVYVVFYRNQDENGDQVLLNGNDVLTNEHIIGLARLPHRYNADGSDLTTDDPIHGVTSEWQQIDIDLVYTEEPDATILANNGYSLVMGFTSSWQGAYFNGAIGSKLWLDNVVITCE